MSIVVRHNEDVPLDLEMKDTYKGGLTPKNNWKYLPNEVSFWSIKSKGQQQAAAPNLHRMFSLSSQLSIMDY